jgi:hypothetical protein
MTEQVYNVEFDGYWRDIHKIGIPAKSGVYCVYLCKYNTSENTVTLHKLLYIGESNNVNNRINGEDSKPHEKYAEWKKYVDGENEICFSFAEVDSVIRERVEAALIFHHKPIVNTQYKETFPFDRTTVNSSGRIGILDTFFIVDRKD